MTKENKFLKRHQINHLPVSGQNISNVVDLFESKYGEPFSESLHHWRLFFRAAAPELFMIPEILDASRSILERAPQLPEPYEETAKRIPVSQVIDKLQRENKELSGQLSIKESQIKKLKQILREGFKPRILKRISIHGSVLSSISLLISLVYGFNFIHPILAGPLLLISITFLIISISLGKREKALA